MKTTDSLLILLFLLFSTISFPQNSYTTYYPFNGNVNDYSKCFYHAEIVDGSYTVDIAGTPNRAFLFDGIDDYISINNYNHVVKTNEFTICVWAKVNGQGGGLDGQNILFCQRDDAPASMGQSCILFMADDENGNARFLLRASEFEGSSFEMITYPAPDYEEWHHYAATLDKSDTMRLYIDGEQVAADLFTQEGNFCASIDHTYIGCNKHSGLSTRGLFNGAMDEFRIYSHALPANHIKKVYGSEFGGNDNSKKNNFIIDNYQIKEKTNKNEIKVIPNPFSGKVRIEFNNAISNPLELNIYNINGKLVFNKKIYSEDFVVLDNLSLNAGQYTLSIENVSSRITHKIIISD